MPNHVTHRVIVRGSPRDLAIFKDTFLALRSVTDVAGDVHMKRTFDFNILAPMPDMIRNAESSSVIEDGFIVLGVGAIPTVFGAQVSYREMVERYLSFAWVKAAGVTDLGGLKSLLLQRAPDCAAKAEKALKVYEAHGHISWYSWSIANWGTKWNAYDVEILEHTQEQLVFRFDTAWSPPMPIFDALAGHDAVKNLAIEITAFDEMWNFAFVGTISGGHYLGQLVEATDELYGAVFGPPPDVVICLNPVRPVSGRVSSPIVRAHVAPMMTVRRTTTKRRFSREPRRSPISGSPHRP